jgi:DNA-binding transcriptional ArsR family regulator|tara:strand:- start:9 stop:437 length:429 start_codon:yes stop_codon:yes gene_type:complete
MKEKQSQRLINELLNTIDRIGIRETIQALRKKQNDIENNTPELQIHIIHSTCNEFGIQEEILLHGRDKSEARYNAIGVCAFLLSNHLGLTQTKISMLLKKDISTISRHLKRLQNLDMKYKNERDLEEVMQELDKQIKLYKTK